MQNEEIGVELGSKTKKSKAPWIALLVVVVVLAFVGYFTGKQWFGKKSVTPSTPKTYSAVFLTSGQVYFGKLTEEQSYEDLTNVYYIQSTQNGSSTQPVLLHLGSELHQPTDEIKISKSQVLFIETLSSSSPVTKLMDNK